MLCMLEKAKSDSLTAQNSTTQTPLKKMRICSIQQEHRVSAYARSAEALREGVQLGQRGALLLSRQAEMPSRTCSGSEALDRYSILLSLPIIVDVPLFRCPASTVHLLGTTLLDGAKQIRSNERFNFPLIKFLFFRNRGALGRDERQPRFHGTARYPRHDLTVQNCTVETKRRVF